MDHRVPLVVFLGSSVALASCLGGGGASSASPASRGLVTVAGTTYNAGTLRPQDGIQLAHQGRGTTSSGGGSFTLALPGGSGTIAFSGAGFFEGRLHVPPQRPDVAVRDVPVVPVPPPGDELFGPDSDRITNRYLAGLQPGDYFRLRKREDHRRGGDGGEDDFIVVEAVQREVFSGIACQRLSWSREDRFQESWIAEDVYGNVRLLRAGSTTMNLANPPILLPAVAAVGLVLADLLGDEVYVVDAEAVVQPAPELGLSGPLYPCMVTERLRGGDDHRSSSDDFEREAWAPGFGLVLSHDGHRGSRGGEDHGGSGRHGGGDDHGDDAYELVAGRLAGADLGGAPGTSFGPGSATITHPFLAGLRPGDFFHYLGYDRRAGAERETRVEAFETVSGVECLRLVSREGAARVQTLWIAEDTSGSLRVLREDVAGLGTATYAPERSPLWVPRAPRESQHLGILLGGRSREVDEVGESVSTTAGLGYFPDTVEIKTEGDGGFQREDEYWTDGFGIVRLRFHHEDGGFDLEGGVLGGDPF